MYFCNLFFECLPAQRKQLQPKWTGHFFFSLSVLISPSCISKLRKFLFAVAAPRLGQQVSRDNGGWSKRKGCTRGGGNASLCTLSKMPKTSFGSCGCTGTRVSGARADIQEGNEERESHRANADSQTDGNTFKTATTKKNVLWGFPLCRIRKYKRSRKCRAGRGNMHVVRGANREQQE